MNPSGGMGTWLVKLLSLVPYVVSGIEQIHGDSKSGADKKTLAMEALGLADAAAVTVDPNQAPVIQAAADLASSTIDGVKAVFNATQSAGASSASSSAAAAPTASAPVSTPAAPAAPAPAPAAAASSPNS